MAVESIDRNLLLHLLTENELTRCEIAKRLGCSAERVRQLEKKLVGRTGNEARRERKNRALQAGFDQIPFVRAAKRWGLDVEPSKGASDYRVWHKSKLYINGKLCLLRRGTGNDGRRGLYKRLRKPGERAKICIMDVADGDFLIIPMNKMPTRTMFRLSDPKPSTRTGGVRSPWRKYLNNWSAFVERKR
jgi:transcriptional regulator with XRE-family HTH domain